MCLAALPATGLTHVEMGAREEDVRKAGFDEGDKPADWDKRLAKRGFVLTRDLMRMEARAPIEDYARRGGPIYQPHAVKAAH